MFAEVLATPLAGLHCAQYEIISLLTKLLTKKQKQKQFAVKTSGGWRGREDWRVLFLEEGNKESFLLFTT